MMGIKSYQEKIFYNFSLSSKVPQDHLVRKLEKVVDLRFVRDMVADKYSHTGQRSIDPEVLFKMMLIGYFYGITSERRLAEDISVNMAYMWYLGYDVDEQTPHHSVISKARARYGKEVFEEFFNQILEQCVKAGIVSCQKVFADSTYIHANASLKSLVLRDSIKPVFSSKEFVKKLFEDNPVPDTDQVSKNNSNETARLPQKGVSNKDYVSKTDPDSALISHGKKMPSQLAYKEHFTVDSQARVITAVEVTSGAIGDETQLPNLIKKQPLKVKEVGADTKYGTCSNYKYLIERGILPSIPAWEGGSPSNKKRFSQKQFSYNATTDSYTCPNGKSLIRNSDTIHNNSHTYHAKKRDCSSCHLRNKCVSPKVSCRHIFRNINQRFKDMAKQYLMSEHAQKTIRERKTYAEWINAESKTRHGLRRTMFRGLDRVSMQVLMTASVQNIKRLIARIPSPGMVVKELSVNFYRFLRSYLFQKAFA